jgi:hypothetical protein
MKKILVGLMLMAGSTFAQSPYSVPPGAGAPGDYPPAGGYGAPASAYAAPAACGLGYVWIDGYNDANGYFVNGYCAVPPFSGAYWIAPGFFGGRFVAGYWGRGSLGYAPGLGFRGGGYGASYGVRGGYSAGSHFAGGYANGFHAPTTTAGPSFHSQGSYRGGGSAMHGGGSGHGGRR